MIEYVDRALRCRSLCPLTDRICSGETTLSDLLRARLEAGCFNELSPFRAVRPCVSVFVEDCNMSSFVTKRFEEVPS